jgi:23S rRNA-/tRNA-specific pseudouridylate synthase
MSTLPTRQVENYPTFPCLYELVKEWLSTHPDGIELMRQAASNEEMYWKHMLASAAESSNTKRLKKKTRQYEKLQAKQSSFEPRPVHRLDIDTSGIVCIALTPYALRTAGMMFEQKSVQSGGATEGTVAVDKIYVAMVRGEMKSTGTVSHGIGKIWIPDQNTTDGHHEWACDIHDDESVAFCRPGDETRSDSLQFVEGSVRDAFTSYRVLESATESNNSSKDTRVELTPHTGRGHQLRLHMVSLGHPIVGESICLLVCFNIMQCNTHSLLLSHLAGDTMHGDSLETNHKIEKLHLHATNLSIDCYVLDGDDFQRCKASVSSEPWF